MVRQPDRASELERDPVPLNSLRTWMTEQAHPCAVGGCAVRFIDLPHQQRYIVRHEGLSREIEIPRRELSRLRAPVPGASHLPELAVADLAVERALRSLHEDYIRLSLPN